MPTTTNLSVTFNGIADVPRLAGQNAVSFDSKFMGYYSVYDSLANDLLKATVKLSGSGWTVKTLRFSAEFDNITIMKDMNGNSGRRIEYLELGRNSDVDLISTRARVITGWDGDKHDVKLGTSGGSISSVNLYAKENILKTGGDWVVSVQTGGTDTIVIGAGGAGSVATGKGNASVTTGKGWVELVRTSDGNDQIKIGPGHAGTVRTGDGNDKVTTGAGWVELISTGDGNDVVSIGKTGVANVSLGNGNDTIKLHQLADGNNGFQISGGSGTDTVDFGAFKTGVTFSLDERAAYQNVATSNPNSVKPLSGWFGESSIENISGTNKSDRLTGDDGVNKLIGRGGADKLNGLNGNDLLNGGGGNDRLQGGVGKDTLNGGVGADLLDGGKGNDVLRGNAGKDVFVFGAKSGTDTVKGYQDGTDTLRLVGHTGGFSDLTITKQSGDKVIVHDNGTIILDGMAGATLTASDFDFV